MASHLQGIECPERVKQVEWAIGFRLFPAFVYNLFMHYLYILRMLDGRFYVGITDNLQRRESQHDRGNLGTRTTSVFGAGPILYHEDFPDLKSALKRERQIKKWSRAKKKALIEGDKIALKRLAKKQRV